MRLAECSEAERSKVEERRRASKLFHCEGICYHYEAVYQTTISLGRTADFPLQINCSLFNHCPISHIRLVDDGFACL